MFCFDMYDGLVQTLSTLLDLMSLSDSDVFTSRHWKLKQTINCVLFLTAGRHSTSGRLNGGGVKTMKKSLSFTTYRDLIVKLFKRRQDPMTR